MRVFFTRATIQKAKKPFKPRKVKTAQYKRLFALSKRMGNAVHIDLLKGLKTFKRRISADELERAWKTGNFGRVMANIPWDKLPEDIEPALKKIGDTSVESAEYQLLKLPPNINKNLRFDVTNPIIRNFIQRRTGELIVGIQSDTQRLVQSSIMRTFTSGWTPRDVAENIKGSIGLDQRLSTALENYRKSLSEQGMPIENQTKWVSSYEDRLLDYRASMIAKTETRLATNHGQLAVWQEGVNQGYIDRESARKEWVVDGDPCETCDPMDGILVGLYDPWIVEYPNGETKAVYNPTETHPHCMCGMELHFTDEAGTENEEGE